MKRLQPVIWMKGTFLSPHHLQTQDRFLESTLQFHLEALNFTPWGFKSLQVNHEALTAGYFGLAHASGIFPDGLLFDMPDSDSLPAPKPLDAAEIQLGQQRLRGHPGVGVAGRLSRCQAA